MLWALVNTITMTIQIQNASGQPQFVEVLPGAICNLIAYDGESPYVVPENYRLLSVPDDARIGDIGY